MEPAQDEQDEADDAQEFASAAEACSVQDELMEVDEDAGQAAMIMCGCANFWGCWARSTDAYEATERGAMPSVDPRGFTSARPRSLFHLPKCQGATSSQSLAERALQATLAEIPHVLPFEA